MSVNPVERDKYDTAHYITVVCKGSYTIQPMSFAATRTKFVRCDSCDHFVRFRSTEDHYSIRLVHHHHVIQAYQFCGSCDGPIFEMPGESKDPDYLCKECREDDSRRN